MKNHPNRLWFTVLVLGWLFDFLFWEKKIGLNFSLFSASCLLGGLVLLLSNGFKPAGKALWLLFPFLFFTSVTFLRQEQLTVLLAYTFSALTLVLMASTYLGGRWAQYGLVDYLSKFFSLIGSLRLGPVEFRSVLKKEQVERGETASQIPYGSIIRGLIIALPIVMFFASMLASADLIFEQKLADFMDTFESEDIFEYIQRALYVSVCIYLLVGIFLYVASQSTDKRLAAEDRLAKKPFLGFTESAIVLGSVTLLFLLFVIIQFQYFFGGQVNIGVEGYTYSQYARRGFSELVTVAFFSLALILGLNAISGRETEIQKRIYSWLSIVLVALLMIILVSAYQRLSLAIDWHGYSRLRLYPRVFMIWLGVLLVAIVTLEGFRLERYFTFAFLLASFGFGASLFFVDVDDSIVEYNLSRVLQGKNLNVNHLSSLSTDAIPALVVAFDSPETPVETREGIGAVLLCYIYKPLIYNDTSQQDWRSMNYSRWFAYQALESVKADLNSYKALIRRYPILIRTPHNVQYECGD